MRLLVQNTKKEASTSNGNGRKRKRPMDFRLREILKKEQKEKDDQVVQTLAELVPPIPPPPELRHAANTFVTPAQWLETIGLKGDRVQALVKAFAEHDIDTKLDVCSLRGTDLKRFLGGENVSVGVYNKLLLAVTALRNTSL